MPPARPSPLEQIGPEEEELDRRLQVTVRRNMRKEEAIGELLAGRLTLVQAAARFRDADAAVPAEWRYVRPDTAPGPGEGERRCREVIARVRLWLANNQPPQAAEVTARLEAELQHLLDKDGVVRLPD
jgi:hypothetical protein